MYQTSDIRKGLKIEMDGAPWIVVGFQFVKPGKGQAFTRTKLKNLLTGAVVDRTYKSGEALQPADVEEKSMQYLYTDGELYHFMDTGDFSQVGIPEENLGDAGKWMVEEMEVTVLFYKGRPVSVDVPNFVELEITYCEPGVRGNTATGATKPATLSTDAVVNVPLFVEQGTVIKIDTRTGEYVGRVS
ncbi:MAG: elongation factor P [Deltaproteobacteria bacterium]|nr:elongation factor P [Deltaproteobacteria bacterium]MBW2258438.1 elongation factor P [Deltaproteobacteria bacterium]